MKHMMIKVLSLVMALTMIMGMFGAVALSAAEHVHTKGEKVKTVAPTCVAYGYTLYECADCGETYADDILAKANECQNIVDVEAVAATCTSNGKTAGKKCADCGTYKEGGIEIAGSMLAHNMVIAITQPTCDEDGEVYEYCTTCNTQRNQIKNLPALGDDGKHVTEYTITKAPTCGESGLATWGCVLCDEYTVEGIYITPNPDLHVWVEVDDKPTCLAPGFKGWECTDCWETTIVDPETGDELENGGLVEAYNHLRDVTKITASNYEGYAYFINNNFKAEDLEKAATCVEDGFYYVHCNDCKTIQKIVVEAYEHSFENNFDKGTNAYKAEYVVKTVAATCENAGYVVVKCDNYAVCDCEETKTIVTKAALSSSNTHTWWSDFTEQYKGDCIKYPSVYKWNRIEPTCTTGGYTIVVCKNKDCTATKKFDAVDALGHDYEYRCDECGDVECLNCQHDRTLECVIENCTATKAVTKPAEHKMSKDKDVMTIPATCSQYAYDTYYCKNEDCSYIGDTLYQYAIKDKDGKVIFDTEAGYDADNHSDLKEMVITPSTCLTEGKAKYSCSNCNVGTWEAALPVLEGHDLRTEIAELPADCQTKGHTAGIYCPDCAALQLGKITGIVGLDDGYGYIKGVTATAKNAANHKVGGAVELFHRPGTCNIKELTVYKCTYCSTNEKNVEFEVVGELDVYNHNKYVYVNNVLDATQSSSTVTAKPAYIVAYEAANEVTVNWGACIEYTPAQQTCLDAGWHANLKCTACKVVLAVSATAFTKYTTEGVDADTSLLYVDTTTVNATTGRISNYSEITCAVCKAYNDPAKDGNNDKTAAWEESPHFTFHYAKNEDGSYLIDPSSKTKVIESFEVQLVLPATGHTLSDVAAVTETCTTDGHTAGKNCTNAWAKDLAALKDKDTTNDDSCGYKEGQTFIPAHGDNYTEWYNGVTPTCSTYGVGVLYDAIVYQNERYTEFVVIPQIKKNFTVVYKGQYLIRENGEYKVIEADDITKHADAEIIVTPAKVTNGVEQIGTVKVAIGGKWCTKCENAKDITNRGYYLAPLAHDFVVNTATKSCTEFGWAEVKCTKCTANGAHWLDRDGDNVVDVAVLFAENEETGVITVANAAEVELSWFFTNFEYATGHDYTEYDDVDDAPEGWIMLGEVVSNYEKSQLIDMGYENVFGIVNKCTTDTIKYTECENGCGSRQTIGDKTVAAGHYFQETNGTKTPISTACNEIDKWVGYACSAPGCTVIIYKDSVPTHDLVEVQVAETCTKTGLQGCFACVDCDDYFVVYVNDDEQIDLIALDFTPTVKEATAAGYDYDLMCELVEGIVIPKHAPTITKVDAYVPATETVDGYWTYTCMDCGETVTEKLEAESQLVLDITVEDVNGAKVTANGNEIVVKVAYTAKEYKFRALDLDFYFDNYSLTFNKAEIKAEYDESLNVITDVAVDEDAISVLTYVPNGLKQNATLTGEDVAFIYFYFTVNSANTIDEYTFYLDYVDAKYYDAETGLNEDQSQYVTCNYDYVLEVGATGDVDNDYEIDYSDLLDMMDIIYTEGAKYNAMADVNKDGVVDVEDFAALKTFVGTKQTAADYAEMIGVELPDLEAVALQVLNIEKLDVNGDDKINKADLVALCDDSYILDMIVNDFDGYGNWDYYFFVGYYFAFADEAEVVDTMTEIIIYAYQGMGGI